MSSRLDDYERQIEYLAKKWMIPREEAARLLDQQRLEEREDR